ncbi:MAG: hypothetical protein HN341_11140, partial [Verrucomicrobia bacterium]|nr:hypothetical protein [Verrucomicrobiota bacterium]
MKRIPLIICAVSLGLWLAACGSSSNGKSDADSSSDASDLRYAPDGAQIKPDTNQPRNSPAFTYNGEVCKIGPVPQSGVTGKVEAGADRLDAFAQRLKDEGYDVYRGPEQTVIAEPVIGDVVTEPPDIMTRESMGMPDVSWYDEYTFEEIVEEIVETPVWDGGEYLIARTPLSDLIFVLADGTIGVVSWCPAHSLGQIRRLDYTLADAIRMFGDIAAYDYATETEKWTMPVAYYTGKAGSYQRSYMNDSLTIDERHDGQVSITGKPIMAGFALFGHADAPSQVGDVVGVDLLQVGQKVLAENDTVTVTGQVVRLWDFTPLAGEGEIPVI